MRSLKATAMQPLVCGVTAGVLRAGLSARVIPVSLALRGNNDGVAVIPKLVGLRENQKTPSCYLFFFFFKDNAIKSKQSKIFSLTIM